MNKNLKIVSTSFFSGYVLLYGHCHDLTETLTELSKTTLDIPQVRLGVLNTGYALATEMLDRYSYWPKILPLILIW